MAGWDPAGQVLVPSPSHPLLRDGSGPGPGQQRPRQPGCAAVGCPRQVTAAGRDLCREHRRRQRISGDLPLEQFLSSAEAGPLLATGPCHVRSCPRDRTSRTQYCEAHQYQLRAARDAAGGEFNEEQWRAVASPVPVRGQVSFRGLPPRLAAELLFGLQQRTRDGLSTRLHVLRALVEDLRRCGALSLDPAWQSSGPMAREKGQIGRSLARYVRAAAGDTAAEAAKDEWDLIVFGSPGTLTFTGIAQYWLRESVKRWAADELPRTGGSARTHGSGTSLLRWPGCRRTCTPPAATMASGPPSSAAPTSSRSCTTWPTWNPLGSSPVTGGSGSARTPDGCSAGSVLSA